jgi:hypothetical protein
VECLGGLTFPSSVDVEHEELAVESALAVDRVVDPSAAVMATRRLNPDSRAVPCPASSNVPLANVAVASQRRSASAVSGARQAADEGRTADAHQHAEAVLAFAEQTGAVLYHQRAETFVRASA